MPSFDVQPANQTVERTAAMSTTDWINLLKVAATVAVPVLAGVLAMWWKLSAVVQAMQNINEQLAAIWAELKGRPCSDHNARLAVVEERVGRLETDFRHHTEEG